MSTLFYYKQSKALHTEALTTDALTLMLFQSFFVSFTQLWLHKRANVTESTNVGRIQILVVLSWTICTLDHENSGVQSCHL